MRDHKRKHHRKDHNDTEALIKDLAEDTKQNSNANKEPNTIQNSESETPASKMTGVESSRTGKVTRPGGELIAEIDYSKIQISTSLSTISCPLCTFKISCWTQELTKQIMTHP